MAQCLVIVKVGGFGFLRGCLQEFNHQQTRGLVNVKLKWVKDRALDFVVASERDLKAASILVSVISSSPQCSLPVYRLTCHRGQLGLPHDLKLATFIRRYPSVFVESYDFWGGGARVPCFGLTPEALQLHQEELNVLEQNRMDFINRLRKLLMLTQAWTLPLQTLDQLKWDLGLPYDYVHSVIPYHRDLFSFVHLPDDRVGLKLLSWDKDLAVSQLQRNSARQQKEEDVRSGCLAFPVGFTRGDLGLPYDYVHSVIPYHCDLFSFVHLPDDRVGLKLLSWDKDLAVSQLQRNSARQQKEEDVRSGCLAFPVGFTRGFGLKRKCMEWLKEWQTLPYTSPYSDASHLDPRTDVSEKRIVGVFHELLHLTINKKTERKNVSNLRKPLALPQKFTKVFERHPGIFYISNKCATQTVILREAYDRQKLLQKHPTVELRENFAKLLRKGFLDRSKGLYKKNKGDGIDVDPYADGIGNNQFSSEEESDNLFYEYDSDEQHEPRIHL